MTSEGKGYDSLTDPALGHMLRQMDENAAKAIARARGPTAEEIVEGIDAYVGFWQAGDSTIELDGHFTLEQLEALVTVLRRSRTI